MIGKWKSLVDTLQVDLRNISSEAKRKHPAVKDAAERAILKLRSLSAANDKHINEGTYYLPYIYPKSYWKVSCLVSSQEFEQQLF